MGQAKPLWVSHHFLFLLPGLAEVGVMRSGKRKKGLEVGVLDAGLLRGAVGGGGWMVSSPLALAPFSPQRVEVHGS